MDGFFLQSNLNTQAINLHTMPNEQEEYNLNDNYLSKPVKLLGKKEKSTLDYSSTTSAQTYLTNHDLSNHLDKYSKEKEKDSEQVTRKYSSRDYNRSKITEELDDWELIQTISSVPDYFEKLALESEKEVKNSEVKKEDYSNLNFKLNLNVNAVQYVPKSNIYSYQGYNTNTVIKNEDSYPYTNNNLDSKIMIEFQKSTILPNQPIQDLDYINSQSNILNEPVEENFLSFIITLLEENKEDKDKQTQIILNFNHNQMYTFIMATYGREFILERLNSLTDFKEEPISKERLSLCLLFVQRLINRMKSYLFSYIASPYGCEILLKMVNYLNYYERLNLWRTISEANLLFLASEEPTSSIIVTLVKTLTEKCEETFITKLFSVKYLPVPSLNPINLINPTVNPFDQNLLYLVSKSTSSIKVVHAILEQFSGSSVLPFLNFFHNNLNTILLSPIGNELVINYISLLSVKDKSTKDHFLSYLMCMSEVTMLNELGLNTIVYLIEVWGIEFIEAILKNCFLNPTLYFYKDVVSDLGICGFLRILLTHKEDVSSILIL
jgi:hypothetical protein